MPRPQRCRRIGLLPRHSFFKPVGLPGGDLGEVGLSVDEFEALRLADHEGLYQEQAAQCMGVSRQTFGRILESARNKVARALVEGLILKIEGGVFEVAETRTFECAECKNVWDLLFGGGRPDGCPKCQSKNFHRVQEAGRGPEAGRGCCHRGRHGARGSRGRGRRGGQAPAPRDNTELNA